MAETTIDSVVHLDSISFTSVNLASAQASKATSPQPGALGHSLQVQGQPLDEAVRAY